jgi:hypothetical protein
MNLNHTSCARTSFASLAGLAGLAREQPVVLAERHDDRRRERGPQRAHRLRDRHARDRRQGRRVELMADRRGVGDDLLGLRRQAPQLGRHQLDHVVGDHPARDPGHVPGPAPGRGVEPQQPLVAELAEVLPEEERVALRLLDQHRRQRLDLGRREVERVGQQRQHARRRERLQVSSASVAPDLRSVSSAAVRMWPAPTSLSR